MCARDQRDVGAALGGDAGHRVALLARGPIADEADGVDLLSGAARRDEHLDAGQVVGQRIRALEKQVGQRGDLFGLRQPSGAAVGPGESAGRRFEDDCAATAQRGYVVDGGGVEPHLGVHRGCEQHGTSGGQQRGGQQVVGPAGHAAGKQVRGGRRDEDEVGFLPDANMRDLVDVVPDSGVDGVTRQGLEGRGADETQRGLGGNDADMMAGFGELPDHGARLVGGDASGDADDDPLALHAQVLGSSPERLIGAEA